MRRALSAPIAHVLGLEEQLVRTDSAELAAPSRAIQPGSSLTPTTNPTERVFTQPGSLAAWLLDFLSAAASNLLRRINPIVTRVLPDLREKLKPF
jgi:hypothetical protein